MSAIIINPEIQARINQRNKIQALEDQIIHAAKNGEKCVSTDKGYVHRNPRVSKNNPPCFKGKI